MNVKDLFVVYYVKEDKQLAIAHLNTKDMRGDIFTKPLAVLDHRRHRQSLMNIPATQVGGEETATVTD